MLKLLGNAAVTNQRHEYEYESVRGSGSVKVS